ncbi:Ubiquitin-like protein 5 [Entamoeba marina]
MSGEGRMIEVVLNDRIGKKIRVKVHEDDTVKDLKIVVAAHIGTRPDKIKIQRGNNVYQDHISLESYEVVDGMCLDLYYH